MNLLKITVKNIIGKLTKEVLPPQVCAAGGMSASSCAARGVSIAVVVRLSSEGVGWAGWLGATAAVEDEAEEAWASIDGEA